MLRLHISDRDARELVAAQAKLDHLPAWRSLVQQLQKLLHPAPAAESPFGPKVKARPRLKTGAWGTKRLRREVWARSEGRCECPCRKRITWETFELDHFVGRARAPQTPENTWALHSDCHRLKHAGEPTRRFWLRLFLEHLEAHGFGQAPAARKVEAELLADQMIRSAGVKNPEEHRV